MTNLICLDLDGTLEDSRRDMAAAVRRVRAGFGLAERTDEAVLPWVNRGMDALYRNCFDDRLAGGGAARLEEVRRAYEADYLDHVAVETRLYDGIAAALGVLAGIGKLAVVTNKPEKISRRLLDVLGVGSLIAAVVGGDSCAAAKPDPLLLCAAAERAGFAPGRVRTVMIGDTGADIRMGRAYGAATVWCAWGYAGEPEERPDFTARSPGELPGIVQAVLV